jgi:stage II sporulation protein D
MSNILILLVSLISVSKSFTIRIFAESKPAEVMISSSQGSYTIKASGDQLLVNGKPESYFQQMNAKQYTLWGGGVKRNYAGGFTFFAFEGELYVLNYITESAYIASVVASELPSAGMEARKAQAILARTYAYKNMGDHDAGYDLLDSQQSQVYRGLPVDAASLEAAKNTEGLVLGYKGQIAQVYYHSTCGGLILLPSDIWPGATNEPYHRRMADTLCKPSPYYAWEDTFWLDSMYLALNLKARPDSVTLDKDSVGTPVKGFVVYAPDSTYFGYNDLVNHLDHRPRTRRFDVEIKRGRKLMLVHGHGYGHGVGMCQMGAIAMDKAGANYRDILTHYFPGTEIMAVSSIK